jgi:hypothetical protein
MTFLVKFEIFISFGVSGTINRPCKWAGVKTSICTRCVTTDILALSLFVYKTHFHVIYVGYEISTTCRACVPTTPSKVIFSRGHPDRYLHPHYTGQRRLHIEELHNVYVSQYTRIVWKIRGLTLLLRVETLWWGEVTVSFSKYLN